MRPGRASWIRAAATVAALAGVASLATGCANAGPSLTADGRLVAIGAENQYADVISQIGGPYVAVSGIIDNPNTDPHTFEFSPKVAERVDSASLVVQNGLGYDDFMTRIEQADGSSARRIVDVQNLLGLPDSTPNPHLWYDSSTMPRVAAAIASDLEALDPAHRSAFAANLAAFDRSLAGWNAAVAQLRAAYHGAPVATTEPVADYLLQAAGLDNLTPFAFQADVMNGNDPSPQDVAAEQALFTGHRVKAFIYNEQVTDSLTQSLAALAKANDIPVVGVYETMPTPGYTYQTWMLAEVSAIKNALSTGVSAPTL